MTENKVNQKRTLQSTLMLLAIMLESSARDAGEKAFTPIADALLRIQSPEIDVVIEELVNQGYVEIDPQGKIWCTKFGEKIALQSTHNTPNFQRLADSNTNTAFAMLFAGFTSLRDKHLVNQDKIVPGRAGDTLASNLDNLVRFFQDRIAPSQAPVAVFEKKATVKKTKTAEEVPAVTVEEELQTV